MATSVENIALATIDQIDQIENEYINKMDNVMRKIDRDLAVLADQKERDGSENVALTETEVNTVIEKAGYYALVTDFLNNGYQAIITLISGVYADLHSVGISLPDESLKLVEDQRALDMQQFNGIGIGHVPIITRELTNAALNIGNIDAIKDTIISAVSTMNRNANTWITTSLNGFSSSVSFIIAASIGIGRYLYAGPLDGKTRPFCKRHVGQIKTMDQWNELDNGQVNPVGVYRGGYNCRHILLGIS